MTSVLVALLLGLAATSAQASPVNDDLVAATGLGGLEAQAHGTTEGATKEPQEPDHAGEEGGRSVWFSWTAPQNMGVTIETCSDDLDTVLAVYTGSDYPLSPVAADDDSPDNCELRSAVAFSAAAGTTYRIAVDGKGGAVGEFNLRLDQTPANDDLAGAETLSDLENPLPWWHEGNQLATKEPGEPDHAGQDGGHSVWFRWTAPNSGRFSIDTGAYYEGCSSGFDTVLAVYTGSAYPLTEVGSDDDGSPCGDGASRVVFEATAGTTYRIAVDGKGGETGSLELQIRPQPANDSLGASRPLLSSPHVFDFGHNQLATKEVGEPDHAGAPGGHSVWFSWVAPTSGRTVLDTCGSSFDTLLGVYTGSAYPLTQVAFDDDGSPCGEGAGRTEFTAVAGTEYRIAIDGKDGGEGRYLLDLRSAPGNDSLAGAASLPFPLVGDSALSFYTNELATKEGEEPDHAGAAGGHSVWIKWTPPVSTRVRILTGQDSVSGCRSDGIDTLLAVYTGDSYPLTEVASNDDGGGCPGGGSQVEFDAVAETTYRIAVDGKGGAEGSFPLLVLKRPAQDAFADAADLALSGPTSNVLATKEAGEPEHAGNPGGHSLWYFLTPPEAARFELNTCFSSFDTVLGLYTGSGFPLTPLASSDDACGAQSRILLAARPGKTYKIAVDGKNGATGKVAAEVRRTQEELDTFLDSGPAGPTKDRQPGFIFHSNFVDTDFLCRIDSEPFAPCPGGYIPPVPLAPGPHAFTVKASIAGLEDDPTPATRAFVVAGPPKEVGTAVVETEPSAQEHSAATDTVAPSAVFTQKPKALVLTARKTLRVRFGFASSEPGSQFFCKLDGDDYASCTSPTRVPVTTGRHEFRVVAVDPAGNRDATPARWSFRVRRR